VRYRLLCVDKLREPYIASAVDDFVTRLRRYDRVDIEEVRPAGVADAARAMDEEGAALLRRLSPDDRVWLLERRGSELSSEELAKRITSLANDGISRLTLVVAGAFGASASLVERADFQWSLSRLTLLHEWTRALAVEQLYRATKIARGEPYHY
jgi:23S rRNA (pseudouridine1915-N3)-methyltransferase